MSAKRNQVFIARVADAGRRSLATRAAASALLLLLPNRVPAYPVPQVDQSILPPQGLYYIAVSSNQSLGQTFTVLSSGSLARVDLPMGRRATAVAPLQFELRRTSAGLPDLSSLGLLYSTSVDPAMVPAGIFPTTFTLSISLGDAGVPVTAGDPLAIVCSTAGDWYRWASWNQYDLYPFGATVWRPVPRTYFVALSGTDSGFRTWILIPEPSSLLLMVLGLAALASQPRRLRSPGAAAAEPGRSIISCSPVPRASRPRLVAPRCWFQV